MEIAECVIKNSIFEHDNNYFKQKQGTPIDTKVCHIIY